ncbi:MAG: GGDEF domain-containing protein [Kangiellaceae bacterium]|nr:GGDEF domain-containing protein [Kangiellaceae bacterium]MCW9015825.1 GGDEF domain-containing protein [Kangiellaceae bacterium]
MSTVNTIDEQNQSIQKRIDMDMLSRSLPGIVIYAFLWPLIFLPTGFHESAPMISWGISAVLAGLSLLRWLQARNTERWYRNSPKSWQIYFAICSLLQAMVWGLLFYLVIADDSMDDVRFMLVLAIGGLSSGALSALNPRVGLAISNISLILVPGVIASLMVNLDYSLAVLITIYFAYLIMLGMRSHKEYMRAFRIEIQLDAQRKELERLNKIDPLTLIYNRGHFNTTFDFQWNQGIRYKQEQSLLLVDADHFKRINDEHGHLFGDECLVYIANVIHQHAKRKTDVIARFGGEEFAVLLSDTKIDEAVKLAEDIRGALENNAFVFEGIEISVTVSIGVASMVPESSLNSNVLIDNADKALYQAKDSGRNRVISFSAETH